MKHKSEIEKLLNVLHHRGGEVLWGFSDLYEKWGRISNPEAFRNDLLVLSGSESNSEFFSAWLNAVRIFNGTLIFLSPEEVGPDWFLRFEGLFDESLQESLALPILSAFSVPRVDWRILEPRLSPSARLGKKPALFLDRDGVINLDHGYVGDPQQIELVPGIETLIQRGLDQGLLPVVITNQSGIGRGLYSETDFKKVMERINELLSPSSVELNHHYFSPFHPDSSDIRYTSGKERRKPRPGMLIEAARELDLDPSKSIMIGDKSKDLMAGTLAQVQHVILLEASSQSANPEDSEQWHHFQSWLQNLRKHVPQVQSPIHPLLSLKTSVASRLIDIYL
jgi:D-glycero-D-manno-heptose 1,7-bisphosphate phosphatase